MPPTLPLPDPTDRIGVAVRPPCAFAEAAWKDSVVEVTSDTDSPGLTLPLRRGREFSVAIRELEYTREMRGF